MSLREDIEKIFAAPPEQIDENAITVFNEFRQLLSQGKIRAAEKFNGNWQVHSWVKKGILLGFRIGKLRDFSINDTFRFFDKDTYPLKKFEIFDNIRLVPGGSSIRDGAFLAPEVIIMPPAYVNVGAYIDANTMIDSHVLVGSCAQIGKNVHISAGSQIGGVLEPVGALPVIIEDSVVIGGNCGIYEGTIVGRWAVLGAGTILTSSTPVFDLVKNEIYRKTKDQPLIIPEGAVVIPGSRPAKGEFARTHNLYIYTPIIAKYRDDKTTAMTVLEETLR